MDVRIDEAGTLIVEKKTAPQGGAVRYELASGYPPAKPIPAKLRKAAITVLRAERRRRLLDALSSRDRRAFLKAFPSL